MDRESLAVGIGASSCLLVLGLVSVPYLLARPSSVGVYYAAGPGSPLLIGLFAIVATITLLAGARRRSDPALAAGVAVTVSGFGSLLAAAWVGPAGAIAGSLDVSATFDYHRWAFLAATVGLLAGSGLFARSTLSGTDSTK